MSDPLTLIAAAALVLTVVALATIQPWAHRPEPFIRITETSSNHIYGNVLNDDTGEGHAIYFEGGGEVIIKDCTIHG